MRRPAEEIPPMLAVTLDIGVPLEIARLRELTPEQFANLRERTHAELLLADASIELASTRTARTATALIRALALLAYADGGVRAFGRHWCTNHQVCIEAGAA